MLSNKNLTEVERRSQFLQDGDILQFFKEFEGIKRGESYEVKTEKDKDGVSIKFVIDSNRKKFILDKNEAKNYNVYTKNKLELSLNNKIRITQNGKDRHDKELLNGQDLTVTGFDYNGRIVAKDQEGTQYSLPKNFQNFNYGYVSTSHSSQGKTSDHVLIGQSSSSFSASDQKQFYVSVSRGRKGVKIYTDNKQELKEAIMPTRNRMSALDLLKARMEKARIENGKVQDEKAKPELSQSIVKDTPSQTKPQTNHPFVTKKPDQSLAITKPNINPFVGKPQEPAKDLQPATSPPNEIPAQIPKPKVNPFLTKKSDLEPDPNLNNLNQNQPTIKTKKWSDITPTQTQQDYQQSQQKDKERILTKD